MPRVFRVMMRDADGQPTIADDAGLGVRLGIDIRQDAQGNAIIENKGMSVFEHWKDLPFNRKPKRLGGRGDEATFCFRLGDGPFASGQLANGLDLLVPMGKNPKHGGVRPEQLVPLATFRADIEATREDWVFDENP
jgi:hypothetical protein